MNGYLDQVFFDRMQVYQSRVLGLLLIIVGIVFLYTPSNLHLKVSSIMILIGILMFSLFDINEKSVPKAITGKYLTAILILWILFIFLITGSIDFDIFLVIVILGIFTIKELIEIFLSLPLKKRFNILFYLLFIVFLFIIGQKVIYIVGF